MARSRIQIARTYAPIHFEDLDPHRFEDLIRELIYDFRDWQTIEATGRSGQDAGFDIRAFEKSTATAASAGDDEGEAEGSHPMDGRRWMIQGKREKQVSPAAVRKNLADVDADDPPYGYILAASAVFSKKSYDVFREGLRNKGVMEFYLWGKPELEDMLHFPKNDRILFTFFGISLASKRRSRTTELRSLVTIKNKLHKVLGNPGQEFHQTVLLRDVNDMHYPYKREYADFDKRPRWIERAAFRHHPIGFFVHSRRYYAYVDRDKKEWDYTDQVDLLWPQVISDEKREQQAADLEKVKDIWGFLPRAKQGQFSIEGFIKYEDVTLVDGDGDGLYRFPHIYADFSRENGPYSGSLVILSVGEQEFDVEDGWKRIDFFPKDFSQDKRKPRVHTDRKVELDPETVQGFLKYGDDASILYASDDRYEFLQQRDIIAISTPESNEQFLRITHIQRGTFGEFIREYPEPYKARRFARRQLGREIGDADILTILETERAYPREWQDL